MLHADAVSIFFSPEKWPGAPWLRWRELDDTKGFIGKEPSSYFLVPSFSRF